MNKDDLETLRALNSQETDDSLQPNFTHVKTCADNISDIVKVANNILEVLQNEPNITAVAGLSEAINTINSNINNINAVNLNEPNINLVKANETNINALAAIVGTLNALGQIVQVLIDVDANKTNINAVNANKTNIDLNAQNMTAISNALANANAATLKANEALTFRNEAEQFRNEAQSIAGGNIVASLIQFSDLLDLQTYRTNTDNALATINTLLQSDDTTLDELQELVDFIKENKTELDTLGIANISGLQTALDGKIAIADIVDNLTTADSTKVLSANQGVQLKTMIDNITTLLSSDDLNLDTLQEVVDALKNINMDTLSETENRNFLGSQNPTTLTDIVIPDNTNKLLVGEVDFTSLSIGNNSSLRIIL